MKTISERIRRAYEQREKRARSRDYRRLIRLIDAYRDAAIAHSNLGTRYPEDWPAIITRVKGSRKRLLIFVRELMPRTREY